MTSNPLKHEQDEDTTLTYPPSTNTFDEDDDEDLFATHFDLPPAEPLSINNFIKNLFNFNINYCWVKTCLIIFGLSFGILLGVLISSNNTNSTSFKHDISSTKDTQININNLTTININNQQQLINPTNKPTPFIRKSPSITTKLPTIKPTIMEYKPIPTLKPTWDTSLAAPSPDSNIFAPSPDASIFAPSPDSNIMAPSPDKSFNIPTINNIDDNNIPSIEKPKIILNEVPTTQIKTIVEQEKHDIMESDKEEIDKNGRLTTTFVKLGTNIEESELKLLETKFSLVERHLNDNHIHDYGIYYGSYNFNIEYPNDNKIYEDNFIRKWCWNMNYKKGGNNDIKGIDIEIKFKKFEVEIGFDKIILRHFNNSMVDLPKVFAGRGKNGNINDTIKYYLKKGESKNICIEFMTDYNIGLNGINFYFNIKYDICKWKNWDKCYKIDLRNIKWGRGPFSNGKCGVGVMSKERLNEIEYDKYKGNGISNCKDNMKIGPEYCTKAPCEHWDNLKDPDFPPKRMPGWAWFNLSRYYNGRGRLDPVYPDMYRMYLSENKPNTISLDKLSKNMELKINKILSEHQKNTGINIFTQGLFGKNERELFITQLGSRVLDSLLIGRPFVVITTGDSVCSGHDNQLVSTYSYQLQTRLRQFWVQNGVQGSAFTVRNIAEGGGMDQWTQSYAPYSMATENFDFFNPLNYEYNDTNIIKEADIVSWEAVFTEGRSMVSQRETHLRNSLILNALWGQITPIGGVKKKDGCKKPGDVGKNFGWQSKLQFDQFIKPYLPYMGAHYIDTDAGLTMACPVLGDGPIESTRWGDDGPALPELGYGYSSYYLKANWHPNPRGHRIMSDFYSFWILKSGIDFIKKFGNDIKLLLNDKPKLKKFFNDKSGRYRDTIVDGIKNGDQSKFVKPVLCNDKEWFWCNTIPFALTGLQPDMWNIHFRLKDYLYNVRFEDISKVHWLYKRIDNQIAYYLRTGGTYASDEKWFFQPDSKFFKDKDIKWQIDNKMYLQFLIKTPKYGNGIIHVVPGYRCEKKDAKKDIGPMDNLGYYIKELLSNENGIGNELNDVDHCQFTGLKKNTKYIITLVDKSKKNGQFAFLFGR